MKRTILIGSLSLMLAIFGALGAQNHHNNWQGQQPGCDQDNDHQNNNYQNNNHQNNNNHQSEISEFRGILVNTDRNGCENENASFSININHHSSANIHYNNSHQNYGYGIMVRRGNGERAFFSFDRKGDRMAQRLVSNRWRYKKNIVVEVRGILNHRTRTIEVVSMERIPGNRYWQSNNFHNPNWDNDGPGHQG